MNIDQPVVGYLTRHSLPLMMALIKKRQAEGNPICISDPQEYLLPYYAELAKLWLEERSEQDGI